MSDDWIKWHETDFETELSSLNRSHVSTRTFTKNKPVTSYFSLEMRATDIPPPMTTASYCPEGVASPRVVVRCQRPTCRAAAGVCRASCDVVYGKRWLTSDNTDTFVNGQLTDFDALRTTSMLNQ